MTTIVETVTIDADIEAVFDLISRVEEFPLYAKFLSVRKIDQQTYEWVARARGLTLTWASVITEFERPVRLAWKSVRGLQNWGAYTLTRSPRGTIVSILIGYHLPGAILEEFAAPLAERLMRSLAAQVLAEVKRRFEADKAFASPGLHSH